MKGNTGANRALASAMDKFRANAPEEAVVDAMLLCAYCDGLASAAELGYVVDLRFGRDPGRANEAIRAATKRLRDDGSADAVVDRVARLAPSAPQREEVFAFAAALLYADGNVSEDEDQTLGLLGTTLGIEVEHGGRIVDEICALVEAHDPMFQLPADMTPSFYFEDGARWEGFSRSG
jgi:tellurite resistance protein